MFTESLPSDRYTYFKDRFLKYFLCQKGNYYGLESRFGKLDLGVIIHVGATAVYTEGPLLEAAFFVISHYMFRPNWPSSGVTAVALVRRVEH
jgi:hypothetical protein